MAKPKSRKHRERRKHPRFRYPLYISYKKNGKKFEKELLKPSTPFHHTVREESLSVSRNISVGGICFITKERLPFGTKLLVKIWSPAKHEPLVGLAEVIWQEKRTVAPGYITGVAFASLDDERELEKLLDIFTELKVEKTVVG